MKNWSELRMKIQAVLKKESSFIVQSICVQKGCLYGNTLVK